MAALAFAAIDFETATRAKHTAASAGVARVDGLDVTTVAHTFINPPGDRWEFLNVGPIDVLHAPTFPGAWFRVAPLLVGVDFLAAHNAPFDRAVLEECFRHFGSQWPPFRWACSLKMARAAWPDLPDHKLSTVASHLGIRLRHHHAASDAEACARIVLAAIARGVSPYE